MYRMYGILMLNDVNEDPDVIARMFEPYEWLERKHYDLDPEMYSMVYCNELETEKEEIDGELLERIYYMLNMNFPEDYRSRSLSVSDIILFDDSAYYVDSIGFHKLDDFEYSRFAFNFSLIDYFLPFC